MTAVRVVLAPDKFKGSASASQVCAALAAGFARVGGLSVTSLPMADGGEGTVDAAIAAGYQGVTVPVHGPLGLVHSARLAVLGEHAVIEMAAASGLEFTAADGDAAARSCSRGTGELIVAALDQGARQVVIGVGGSASTDGGAGLLTALGAVVLDGAGRPVAPGGAALTTAASVDLSGLDRRLSQVRLVLASDVDNPLLGERGAAAVFGPQKGADAALVQGLDAGLRQWVRVLAEVGVDAGLAQRAGAGAAGGVGFALLALGAQQRPGVEQILELTGFARVVAGADLVVTGEGSLDEQSLGGKTPVGVAAAAAVAGVPVVAVAGRCMVSAAQLQAVGIREAVALVDLEPDVGECMRRAPELLEQVGETIGRRLTSK